jgi:hypothetical protein
MIKFISLSFARQQQFQYNNSLCSMRAMPIQVFTGSNGIMQMKAAFRKNWKHYFAGSAGLAIFMVSACFFSAMIFLKKEALYHLVRR